jgi:hypothetical protein
VVGTESATVGVAGASGAATSTEWASAKGRLLQAVPHWALTVPPTSLTALLTTRMSEGAEET